MRFVSGITTMAETILSPYDHDLRNSLYVTKGLIESFLLDWTEGRFLDKEGALQKSLATLKKAHTHVEQASHIVEKLRVLLKGERRRGQAVSVREAWPGVFALLAKAFSLGKMEILERIPENFPLLRCHRGDLKEILYHLSRNAVQAMAGEGKLVIRASVSFSTKEEPFATIQIADTGPGIPKSKLASLFLPFYTTKSSPEGTGIGLYLTRQLVLRNDGRITVSSFSGAGTTFTLEFLLAQ